MGVEFLIGNEWVERNDVEIGGVIDVLAMGVRIIWSGGDSCAKRAAGK